MATTTNYGWETPDDTDLVKDGASAIRTLGSAIDTTVFNNASAGIAKTIIDAKGDLISATAADTPARLAVGTDGQVLTADSTEALGLKWATSSAGANWSLLNSGGTSLSGAQTVTVSGISGKDRIMVLISGASSGSTAGTVGVRLNADTGSNYYMYGVELSYPSSYVSTNLDAVNGAGSYIYLAKQAGSSASSSSGNLLITGCNSSGVKVFQGIGSTAPSGGNSQRMYAVGGYYNSSTVISSISVYTDAGVNMDAGTVYVYASA